MITKNQKNFLKKSLIQQNLIILKLHKQASLLTFNRHPKKNENTEIDSLENKVETNEMKPKKSIFSKIFGFSNKTNVKNIPEVSESDDTTEFKNEIKEIFEENKKEDSQLDFEENDT